MCTRLASPLALGQQRVTQVLLRVAATLADAPDGECFPGTLSMPQVIGPQHPVAMLGFLGGGGKQEGKSPGWGSPGRLWKCPNATSCIHPGTWALPESKLANEVGNNKPLPSSPGARTARPPSFSAMFTFCFQILLSLCGTPHFPLQSPNPSPFCQTLSPPYES